MSEFLSYGFVQRALVAGALVGVTCAVLAIFVVLRRMAFIGVGLSHAALGGVAVAVLAGLPVLLTALVFALGVGGAIGWSSGRGEVSEDTAIGILFPTAMALGVALMSFSRGYGQDLIAYLFGNILSVGPADLRLLLPISVVSLALLALFFKELLYLCVDEEAARAAGIPVRPLRYLLLGLLALTVVAAMKLVGIILVSAFLVIPAATGQVLGGSIRQMLVVSVAAALLAVGGGLWLSWLWNLPSGAAIVLLSAGLFFAAFLARSRAPGAQ